MDLPSSSSQAAAGSRRTAFEGLTYTPPIPSQLLDKKGEVGGQRALEDVFRAGCRVAEAEPAGMERLARETCERAGRRTAAAIDRVADQRMADMRRMDPDLVRAPRLEPAFDERRERAPRRPCETFPHREAGDRPPAARAQHRHALPVGRM